MLYSLVKTDFADNLIIAHYEIDICSYIVILENSTKNIT